MRYFYQEMKCTENLPNLTFTRLCLYMNGELKILQPIIIVKRWVGSHCHSLNALEWQFLISVGHQFKEHFQKKDQCFPTIKSSGSLGWALVVPRVVFVNHYTGHCFSCGPISGDQISANNSTPLHYSKKTW